MGILDHDLLCAKCHSPMREGNRGQSKSICTNLCCSRSYPFWEDVENANKNRQIIPTNNRNEPIPKSTIDKHVKSSLTQGVNILLTIIFILAMISMILGCLLALTEMTTLSEIKTKLFPFLFKNLGVMGFITLLICLNNFLDKRMQNKN
ncbi:hypothetical protein [Robertmurraya massiliosenegalensis]|uniref:hypothetical protein n=1 Tax=Robertmurraya massiliosenegalensis TaxID=1287657 RepID=UPI00037D7A75|nr:hypothetical protein [Robertmurraya massiliosenegalensis]